MKKEIFAILNEKYKNYAQSIIAKLESQSGYNYENVWLEFADQVQNGSSIFYEMYEDLIFSFISELVSDIPRYELKLLWLRTENYTYFNPVDNELFADSIEMEEAVVSEI